MEPTRIGVIGCGNVSHMYMPILARVPAVEVVAVADLDPARAHAVGREYGVLKVVDPSQLLDDPAVDIVLNLTPISAHATVSKAALTAGKHVYSEKPLANNLADAFLLVEEARARGLALACAPDTLLGTGYEVAREALVSGAIGHPLAGSASMYRAAMRRASFYTEGTTPFFDMAPYYLTALVNLFGPAVRVGASTRTAAPGETPTAPAAGAPIVLTGFVEFASGITSDLTLAWGTEHRHELATLTVYGSQGVLALPNPNNFGDPAFVRRHGEEEWNELPGSRQPASWPRNLRGLGVAEMAWAIRAGQPPRASSDIACHVVDLIESLARAASTGTRIELSTTCTPARPLPMRLREELLG